jgi:hypothetical protein
MEVTFKIWARRVDGSEFECFAWCRDAASGIARAWREAPKFGEKLVSVWAIPA